MKLNFFAVAMPLALMLTACDKQEDKFAGFTAVGADKKASKFYLDTNTVKRNRSGWVSFNMVRDLTDSYVIQNAETNCENRFIAEEGVKYRLDGTSQEKFASETMSLPVDNSDITALVKMACDTAEENRTIKGAFDDGKALEILFGNYDANSKTASWEKIDPPNSLEGSEKFAGKTGTVKILESKYFEQDGKKTRVILTATSIADSPRFLISAVIFVKGEEKWSISKEYPYLKLVGKKEYSFTSNSDSYNNSSETRNRKLKSASISLEQLDKDDYTVIENVIDETTIKRIRNSPYNVSEQDLDNNYIYVYNFGSPAKPLLNFELSVERGQKQIYKELTVSFFKNENHKEAKITYKFIDESKTEDITKNYRFDGIAYLPIEFISTHLFDYQNKNFRVEFYKTPIFYGEKNVANEEFWNDINNCYGFCTLSIDITTYQKENKKWIILSEQKNTNEAYFDTQEKWVNNFNIGSNIGFLVENGYSSGNHGGSNSQYLYVYNDKQWKSIGEFEIDSWWDESGAWDDAGNYIGQSCKFDGKVSVSPESKNKDYPNLLLKGTEDCTQKEIKKSTLQTTLYVFNGKEYEEKKNTKVPAAKNEKVAVVQNTLAEKSSVMQMIDYALDNGGVGHESEIQEEKLKIESSPKPKKGNKKAARKINDEGHALLNKQDIDGAVAKFAEASRLDPSDVEIINNLGFAYLKQKNFDAAQKALISTLIIAPNRAAAWANLGDVFALIGDERKAVACYSHTYRFSKDIAKTHQFMKKMNAAEDVPALKQARDGAMSWAQKVYPELDDSSTF